MLVINIAMFAAMMAAGAGLWHRSSDIQLAWGANFGPATQDGQWWRLGSAMFLHFGVIHLAMNMLALWDVGRVVEKIYGSLRFVLVYLSAGLAGNLLSLVVRDGKAVSGGASGAIFGLYGALLAFAWYYRGRLHRSDFRWFFWGAGTFALVMIAIGQMLAIVDNAAHIGGLIAGIVSGTIALPSHKDLPSRFFLKARVGSAIIANIILLLLLENIPQPRYLWSDELSARTEIARFISQDAAISTAWQNLLDGRNRDVPSFDFLAGEIETQVASRYENSFEQISKVHLAPATPSASALAALQTYAAMRREASRAMVEGLRTGDQQKIKSAIDIAKRSKGVAKPAITGISKPTQSPSR